MQKSTDAKRIYSTVLNVKTNTDGFKDQGITFPNGQMQNRLIRETYEEIGLHPNDVAYVEAHGTGTKVGDPQEVNSICDFFCKDRKTPLLIGSVKSNMGHSEPASGVCSIAKILIAMEAGVLPANLHFQNPNPDLYGLMDGRMKVVDRNMEWNGGIVGLNSFGFGGANAHVILKSNPKPKPISSIDDLPRLVVCSGRTEDAVQKLLEDIEIHKADEEYLGLINEIHSKNIPMHYFRGYTVVGAEDTLREVSEYRDEKRPIWYIYAGMGSQWASMAKEMMQVEVFRTAIQRCAEVLLPEGIDLIDILTRSDESKFDNILNSFVSIAAVQVGLTDVLTSLGVTPDGMIGHSVGELGCAYADGCFTPEQTVLAAYWRGRSILDTDLVPGQMAAVGLSWEECQKRLPKDVIAACHNSVDSVTISGPTESINKVVKELSDEGIFAKVVKSSGVAFHSKYIADAAPKLRKSLDKIIPTPKNRTERWLSSSIPEEAWNSPVAKQSSSAYHVNNLLSPVLFHSALQHIPQNAICIEIAPHGLLQAILKRSLGPDCTNISLMKRQHTNNVKFMMQNVGKLYAAGGQPLVSKLYRPITYPVGRGTPMLNSKILWDHSQKWILTKFSSGNASGETVVDVNLTKEEDTYLAGHNIDGRVLFPATGYLTLAWKTFAKMQGSTFDKTPVVMENIVFHRATILPKDGSVKFGLNFFDGSGKFEICEGGSLAVSGSIKVPENIEMEDLPLEELKWDKKSGLFLERGDIYKELRLRGYDYGGLFRGITKTDTKANAGELEWANNWISFMDTMLQFSIMGKDLRELYLPTRIERVVIDPMKHMKFLENGAENVPCYMYKDINVIKSGGVEMRGLRASLAPRRSGTQASPQLERYVFVPNTNRKEIGENLGKSKLNAMSVATHLAIENSSGALKMKVVEYIEDRLPEYSNAMLLQEIIESEPTLASDVAIVTNQTSETYMTFVGESGVRVVAKDASTGPIETNCHLALAYDLLTVKNGSEVLKNLKESIKEDGFILLEETLSVYDKVRRSRNVFDDLNLVTISEQIVDNKMFVLLRPTVNIDERDKQIIMVTETNFKWLDDLKNALIDAETGKYSYIVCQGEELFGALGFMNCIKNEAGGKLTRLLFVQDKNVEKFTLTSPAFTQQLKKDLISNVMKNGVWGTFRHLRLDSLSAVPSLPVEHAYVNALTKGDLASLKWIEGPLSLDRPEAKDSRVELCTVYYAPINFRDVMLSSGKLSADALPGDLAQQDCILGLEFSGRDSTGKRIMAMVQAKSLATTCVAQRNMMWEVPDKWTMEQASTVPCVYATVYYALVVRGKMRKGETILIHAGSGGVGQAAISVALKAGLTVFTTVGSKDKREFLKKNFPEVSRHFLINCFLN